MRWLILKFRPQLKKYVTVEVVEADHAPAALLKSRYKSDPLVIARPDGDSSVPIAHQVAYITLPKEELLK